MEKKSEDYHHAIKLIQERAYIKDPKGQRPIPVIVVPKLVSKIALNG